MTVKEAEFKELAKKYEDAWRRADAEKRTNGKVSRRTTGVLIKLENELNKQH